MLATAAEGVFRGLGDTRAPFRAAALAALVNAALDPLLMVAPARAGVAGAAAATAVAQGAQAAFLVAALARAPALRRNLDVVRSPAAKAYVSWVLRARADAEAAVIVAEAEDAEVEEGNEALAADASAALAAADSRGAAAVSYTHLTLPTTPYV